VAGHLQAEEETAEDTVDKHLILRQGDQHRVVGATLWVRIEGVGQVRFWMSYWEVDNSLSVFFILSLLHLFSKFIYIREYGAFRTSRRCHNYVEGKVMEGNGP